MSRDLLDLVRELNTLNDDNLADRVIANSDVQWCLSELQDILEEMPTLTPPNEWVSVEERLPEDADGMVLLTDGVAVQTGYRNQLVRMDGRSGVFVPKYRPSGGAMEVTHWMLLPAPPTKEE